MTNEVLNAIYKRRSIKAYKSKQIKSQELETILDAALYAPNGMGAQSPVFIAVTDTETRNLLSKLNARVMGAETDPFYGAPCVVCVLADRSCSTAVEDASLSLGTMCLAAHSIGIGSCWIHRARQVFDSDEGKALLKKWLPNGDYIGVGFCILGYPATEKQASPRKENRIFYINGQENA